MMLSHHGTLDLRVLLREIQHILVSGASGVGKTYVLILIILWRLRDPRWSVIVIDPEGDISAYLLEYCANPANSLSWRTVHFLRPADTSQSFSLPILRPRDRSPQACHEAALRTVAVFETILKFGEFGPRTLKLFQLGTLGLALTGRPLCDLPQLFTLGAEHLREIVERSLPYEFLAAEMRSLDVLSDKNPTRFLEYCESITSRLMPTFSNPMLRRIYGPGDGIDLGRIMAKREAVILDLSGLPTRDAILLGSTATSLLFHESLHRPVGLAPRAFVAIDEVFDFMTTDLARSFDRLRKRNVQLCIAIQRLGQLQ